MPRSFLIKKKTTDAASTAAAVDFRKVADLSGKPSRDDFVTSSVSTPSPTRDITADDDECNSRCGSPEETITDKNGNNTKKLMTSPSLSTSPVVRNGVTFSNTVLPVPRRMTIWSPAADIKAEVDAAAAAEMALKLVAKANGINKDALGSLTSLAGVTPRPGVGKCYI